MAGLMILLIYLTPLAWSFVKGAKGGAHFSLGNPWNWNKVVVVLGNTRTLILHDNAHTTSEPAYQTPKPTTSGTEYVHHGS